MEKVLLDSVRIRSTFLLSDANVSLFIVPCLDQHDTADKDDHVNDRESKEGGEELSKVVIRECRDLFFASNEGRWRRRTLTCANHVLIPKVSTALAITCQGRLLASKSQRTRGGEKC